MLAGAQDNDILSVARYDADGALDTSLGGDGIVQYPTINNVAVVPTDIRLQEDGKYVMGGVASDNRFAVVRLQTSGELDADFGNEGAMTDRFFVGSNGVGLPGVGLGLALQANGRIVISGFSRDGTVDGEPFSIGVARLLARPTNVEVRFESVSSQTPELTPDFSVPVQLIADQPVVEPISFDVAADQTGGVGQAIFGSDFTTALQNPIQTIVVNETDFTDLSITKQIQFNIIDDALFEGPESFRLRIQDVTPFDNVVTVTQDIHEVLIVDDETATLTILDLNQSGGVTLKEEPSAGADLQLQLTVNTPSSGLFTPRLAIPITVRLPGNADFVSGTATFTSEMDPGAIVPLHLNAIDDQIFEELDEEFQQGLVNDRQIANLSSQSTARVRVVDNDRLRIAIAPRVVEGESAIRTEARYAVNGIAGGTLAVSLPIRFRANADYQLDGAQIPAGAGDGISFFSVSAIDDALFEALEESFSALVVDADRFSSRIDAGKITVVDNERVVIDPAVNAVRVREGGPARAVALSLRIEGSGSGPRGFAIPLALRTGFLGNSDYTSTRPNFVVGTNHQLVSPLIAAVDDLLSELTIETFPERLQIFDANERVTGGSLTVIVEDNEFPRIIDPKINEVSLLPAPRLLTPAPVPPDLPVVLFRNFEFVFSVDGSDSLPEKALELEERYFPWLEYSQEDLQSSPFQSSQTREEAGGLWSFERADAGGKTQAEELLDVLGGSARLSQWLPSRNRPRTRRDDGDGKPQAEFNRQLPRRAAPEADPGDSQRAAPGKPAAR